MTEVRRAAAGLQVSLHPGESQESLLGRFQTVVQRSGILRELRSRRHFVSKSEQARLAAKKAARKAARRRARAEGSRSYG